MPRNRLIVNTRLDTSGRTPVAASPAASAPDWVLPGSPAIDLWFATGRYWGTEPAAMTFTRTTTAYGTFSDGRMQLFLSGIPVITDLGYAVFKAATNLVIQSQFAASWTATRSTLTANAVASPAGSTTAATLIEDATATNTHLTVQAFVKAASALAYSYTVFAKASTRTRIMLQLDDNAGNGATCGFDLSGGQIAYAAAGLGTPFTSITGSITALASTGWYRCELNATSNTATALNTTVFLDSGSGTAAQSTTYSGDGASGAFIWGAQLEQSSFSTSYIPTTTAAVTKNADALSKSLANISSTLISAGATWSFQGYQVGNATFRAMNTIDDGVATDMISQTHTTAAIVRFESVVSNVSSPVIANASATTTTAFKYAQAWAPGTVSGSFNGGAVSTAAVTLPSITGTNWRIGADVGSGSYWNGYVTRATLFATALSANALRAITT